MFPSARHFLPPRGQLQGWPRSSRRPAFYSCLRDDPPRRRVERRGRPLHRGRPRIPHLLAEASYHPLRGLSDRHPRLTDLKRGTA